jgi:putative ATPase
VKDVREAIIRARERLGQHGQRTVLFIDEVHRFNKAQQDLLLPATETGEVVLIGATTENPYFEVNAALMSRSTLWRLRPLGDDDLATLVRRGLALRSASISDEALEAITSSADGDARSALTTLDTAIVLARLQDERAHVDLTHVARARDGRLYHQSADTHYDQISAFIKSIRGSDPDAAMYWLITLLESGESARFIARRLVILASEDVGLADPIGLLVAESAARAVEFVGLPEARLTLSHATLTLALLPKSNSVTRALGTATAAVQSGGLVEVPAHLRDAHYRSAGLLGHGNDYRYAHDYPEGWVDQQYLPDRFVDATFYEPSTYGKEASLVAQWRARTNRSHQDGPDSPVE